MTERAIKRFIDVEITKGTPSVSAAGFGLLLVLTDSELITTTTRVKSFSNATSVADYFGDDSEEALAADAFFNQNPANIALPDEMLFGRYANAAIAAALECGDSPESDFEVWKLVSDGEFGVNIDGGLVDIAGLDFSSVTSLDDVATVIDTGLGANGDCIHRGDGRFFITSGTTGAASEITLLQTVAAPSGTDISGSDYLDGDVLVGPSNLGGSILSQGQIAEDVATMYTAIENVNNNWYALGALKSFRDIDDTQDMADETESRRKMFLIATNAANTLVSGSTSTFAYYVKNANYKRTGHVYHNDDTLYPDMSWMGQQLPKEIGSTNWAYKTLAGIAEGAVVDIPAMNLSQPQIDAALSVNSNVYTTTSGADFIYFGTMGGGKNIDKEGEYIDILRDVDFLQARTEEALLALLLEVDIVPMTNGGISMTDGRLKGALQTYGVDQNILEDGTVETSFPKKSEISQGDRDDRLLPDGTFQGDLQGGINRVVVRGTVSI